MELRHLRYFAKVVAEGSFSRAAEKLNIAQPPLSRQIRQLEEELGVSLIDRARPLRPTRAGLFFHEQTGQLLERLDEIRQMTKRLASSDAQHFNIGFVASTLYENLPELIRRFRATAPHVDVTLVELTTYEQVAALKAGRIDVGFGRLRFDDPLISRDVLREEPLAIALPRGHPLTDREGGVRFIDTALEPLIIYPKAPRPNYADQVLSLYRDRGVEPRVAFEVRELQTALGLVAAGVGLCIVPASVCRLGRNDIAYIELNEPQIVSPVIMSHRARDKSWELNHLRQLIQDVEQWRAGGPS